jgi:hypothetical protein
MNNLSKQSANLAPEKEQYILRTLPGHLAKASQMRRIRRLLVNFHFIV